MTENAKRNWTKVFEFIPKAITPALLILIIWKGGEWKTMIEARIFPTVQDRVRSVDHTNSSLDPVELDHLRNHVESPGVHMSKKAKDSVYVTRNEYEELIGKSAVTQYKTKEAIEEINRNMYLIKEQLKNQ